jgi:hypothetical protein
LDIRCTTGLPRRDGGDLYEAWLKDDAGVLVSTGTFNDGRDVTLSSRKLARRPDADRHPGDR